MLAETALDKPGCVGHARSGRELKRLLSDRAICSHVETTGMIMEKREHQDELKTATRMMIFEAG